jgi:four helix bundle protein
MRRAVVSIASNVAEGQGRVTSGEFKQFLGHARGSLLELETQIEIANELGFWNDGDFVSIGDKSRELRYLLNRLISSLSPSDGPNTASTTGVIGSDKRRMSSGRQNRRDGTSETSETFETSDTI